MSPLNTALVTVILILATSALLSAFVTATVRFRPRYAQWRRDRHAAAWEASQRKQGQELLRSRTTLIASPLKAAPARPPRRKRRLKIRLPSGGRLPFCRFCRRAMVSGCYAGGMEAYFDLDAGEEEPPCTRGHHHERDKVIYRWVRDVNQGRKLPWYRLLF